MRGYGPECRTAGDGRPALEVFLLGVVDFAPVDLLQVQLVRRVKLADPPIACLILVEHPPFITIGRHGSRAHIPFDDQELESQGVAVRWVARGGGVWMHHPGQLAVYAILPWPWRLCGIAPYLATLRAVVCSTLAEFDVTADTGPTGDGVCVDGRRIADIGIGVSGDVMHYGLVVNVAGWPPWQELPPAPGWRPRACTSLMHVRGRWTDMAAVREAVIRQFEQHFGFERQHLYTSHPMVARRRRHPVYAGLLD